MNRGADESAGCARYPDSWRLCCEGRFGMLTLYDDPMIREIYRRGARDACEWACVYLPSAKQRVMEDWLTALDLWVEGNPPTAPHSRADTSA